MQSFKRCVQLPETCLFIYCCYGLIRAGSHLFFKRLLKKKKRVYINLSFEVLKFEEKKEIKSSLLILWQWVDDKLFNLYNNSAEMRKISCLGIILGTINFRNWLWHKNYSLSLKSKKMHYSTRQRESFVQTVKNTHSNSITAGRIAVNAARPFNATLRYYSLRATKNSFMIFFCSTEQLVCT